MGIDALGHADVAHHTTTSCIVYDVYAEVLDAEYQVGQSAVAR